MTQPTALYFADVIANDPCSKAHHDAAAAELRRLHAENERVFKLADDQDSVIRRQRTERQTLEAQRDALLEALQELCDTLGECGMTEKARAAIKQAEGETR